VDVADLVTPIATTDWDEGELCSNESTLDGDLDFLGELDTETDVAVTVTDGNDGLESRSLTGLGLLLDGHDLHDLVGELSLALGEEFINDLGLLDGNGVSVNLLERLDVVVLNESAELGEGNPGILAVSITARATGARTVSAATGTTASTTASTSITEAASLGATSFTFHLLFDNVLLFNNNNSSS
jgi:hypothetical protein